MLEKGDLLTLSNNKEYLVINQINFEGNNYIYLITKDGVSGIAICKLEEDNLTIVKDSVLLEKLIIKFKEQEV